MVLFVCCLFATLSGVYGLYAGVKLNYGNFMRSSGTICDPNYSAMFYTLGLISLAGTDIIKKKMKIILSISLIFFLILTVSLSGIFGTIFIFIMYYAIKNFKRAIHIVIVVIISVSILLNCSVQEGALYGLKYRILNSIESLKIADTTALTSSRSDISNIYLSYFNELPLKNKLFGGNNTIAGSYRDGMVATIGTVSHNSYIDMFFMIGIIGTILMVGICIYSILKNIGFYKNTNDNYALSIAFLKIVILWYCTNISIFPFRYFVTFFLL